MISAVCYAGTFLISTGEREVPLLCNIHSKQWEVPGKMTLGCQGLCKDKCMNGGTCLGNDVCSCQLGYGGKRCETQLCSHLPMTSNAGVHIM